MSIETLYQDHIKILSEKFDRYLSEQEFDSILIHSGMLQYAFLDDYSLPFRVNPHFAYWLPVTNNPNCFIRYKSGSLPELLYFKVSDYWHSMPEDPKGFWVNSFDIKMINSLNNAKEVLGDLKNTCYIGEFSERLNWSFHTVNPESLIHEIHWDRAIKTGYELHCLKEANRLGAKAHNTAKEAFYNGLSELEIHQSYLMTLGVLERETPYNNIIALNKNTAILHYTECNTNRYTKDKLFSFLIDAGAFYNGYASDITRTYAYHDDEFKAMIDSFDQKQLEIVSEMTIGKSYIDVHRFAHLKVAEFLSEFKIVNLEPRAILDKRISSIFFPHGIGHFLGLQVHDVGGHYKDKSGQRLDPPADHPFLRSTRTIEKNHVYTIEPGVYFIDQLLEEAKSDGRGAYFNWDKIERLKKYGGIRIEDNVSITDNGLENFTRKAFTKL